MSLAKLAANVRPYPIALAHCLAATRLPETTRMERLSRRYLALGPAGRAACKAELHACRQAKRRGMGI